MHRASAQPRRRRRPSCAGGALVALAAALAGGCAVTEESKHSLFEYRQGMDEVQQAAHVFLADFADGLKVQSELQRLAQAAEPARAAEYPDTFEPPPGPSTPRAEAEQALASSRQALALIGRYDDALLALAEGHTQTEIRARASALGGALSTFASLAGAPWPGMDRFAGLGPRIVALARAAENRAALEQAVVQGHAPVGSVLAALEAQTSALYRLSVVGTRQAQTTLRNEIRRTATPLAALLARHGPPVEPGLAGEMAAFQGELAAIGMRTRTAGALPVPFPYSAGEPAYGPDAHATMRIFMRAARASGERYAEVVAKQNAYYRLMHKYVAALRQTRMSLDALRDSLTSPAGVRGEAGRLLEAAFELRGAMADFRRAPARAVL